MKGKPLVGVAMHKLLRICYGVMSSRKPFDPNHVNCQTGLLDFHTETEWEREKLGLVSRPPSA